MDSKPRKRAKKRAEEKPTKNKWFFFERAKQFQLYDFFTQTALGTLITILCLLFTWLWECAGDFVCLRDAIMNALSQRNIYIVAMIFIIVISFQYYLFIVTNEKKIKMGKIVFPLLRFFSLAITIAIWFFSVNGALAAFNFKPIVLLNTPTTSPAPSQTLTPTITLTPMPTSINELQVCSEPETQFPCLYFVRGGDNLNIIANKIYGKDHVDQAGRIIELHRDENGEILVLDVRNELVIPDWNIPLDEQYYEYYFQLIANPIRKCDERFWTPCWYVSIGEPIDVLIQLPDRNLDETCFNQANRVTFNTDTSAVEVKKIGEGVIFVYPDCQ